MKYYDPQLTNDDFIYNLKGLDNELFVYCLNEDIQLIEKI